MGTGEALGSDAMWPEWLELANSDGRVTSRMKLFRGAEGTATGPDHLLPDSLRLPDASFEL
jgi:hypothetical protein